MKGGGGDPLVLLPEVWCMRRADEGGNKMTASNGSRKKIEGKSNQRMRGSAGNETNRKKR